LTAPPPVKRRRRSIARLDKASFLEALACGWTVTHAAERTGTNKRRFYELREADEAFAAAWDDAIDQGTQVLEDELHRRAIEGWDEDSFDGDGKLVRRVRRYSPALLIFSLKARKPDVYRDNARVEVTGRDGGPMELEAGYRPTTLADVVALARDLGIVDVVDGEAVEAPPELTDGTA
jgi:hypothetical protein